MREKEGSHLGGKKVRLVSDIFSPLLAKRERCDIIYRYRGENLFIKHVLPSYMVGYSGIKIISYMKEFMT